MAKNETTPSETPAAPEPVVAAPVAVAPAAHAPHPGRQRNSLLIGLALGFAALVLLGCAFCAGVFVGSHGPQRGGFRGGMMGRGGYGYQLPQGGGQSQGQGMMRGRRGFGGPGVSNGAPYPGNPAPTADATTGI